MQFSGRGFSILLVLGNFIFSSGLRAQNSCDCPEFRLSPRPPLSSMNSASEVDLYKSLSRSPVLVCRAMAFVIRGNDFLSLQQLDSAETEFLQALALLQRINCGDSVRLEANKDLAQVYYQRNDFAKAQEYSFRYLESAISSGQSYHEANSLTMIAHIFNQSGQAQKGIEYARKALPLISQLSNPNEKIDILFKLSKRYLWHFQDTKTKSSLDSSALFSWQQINLARQVQTPQLLAKAFNNLQGIEWEKENYGEALRYLDSAFLYGDTAEAGTVATNYYDKADLYRELRRFDEARRMADSCLYYERKLGNPIYLAEAYGLVSKIAVEQEDYKTAFEAKEKYHSIADSVRNVEKLKQVAELEMKYNQAKNEQTIRELAQQKQIYLLFAIAGLLVAVVIGFYLRQQALRHRQTIMETEQRLNRARMNPHFFFNALSSLQRFAMEENDGKKLASNLSKFSRIMRESLESTYKEYVTIEQEMDFLAEYLRLQELRYPGKFVFGIESQAELEADELLIPSMIIQPFIENSIEHGFAGIAYAGKVTVHFEKEGNGLLVYVRDNGKGLMDVPAEKEHVSRASQIIRDRIYLLNLKLKCRAGFSIDNNAGGRGVTVKIHLPLLRKNEVAADR